MEGAGGGGGQRVAGVCTYGLIGLPGGATALLAQQSGPLLMGLMFVALAGALTAVYVVNLRHDEADVGITSLIAGLLTFAFEALAGLGEVAVAGASAVITTPLLGYKPRTRDADARRSAARRGHRPRTTARARRPAACRGCDCARSPRGSRAGNSWR